MQDIVIARPDASALSTAAAPLVTRAASLVVTDPDEHQTALEAIKTLKGFERQITEAFEPTRKSLDTAKKDLLKLRDGMISPIEKARLLIDGKAATYEREQREAAERETRRLQEEARKAEEERQLAEAVAAEDAGDDELAQSIIEAPVLTPVVYAAPAIAKVEGMSSQTRWSAEVVDKMALIRYVAQHPEWVNLLEPNTVALNKLAVAAKGELRFPGVRAVATTHRVARGA